MVTGIVPRLVFLDGFGEEEWSPVCQAAYHAAMGEDEGAGCAGDSERNMLSVRQVIKLGWGIGIGRGTL